MTRAELVEQVRRLADQTAYLAAEVRRGDTAVELLGQVRDFGHRLPPGLAAEIRWVVDDMVATRHEAQAGPHSPAAGTSSAGGSGQRPPVAPSTETRQAAQDGQSGSGGDAMDGAPAHQPTPQAGDVWQCGIGRLRVRSVSSDTDGLTWTATNGMKYRGIPWGDWRLVERDGNPWPSTQEPEPEPVAVEPATDERPEVLPADDDDLAVVEDTNVPVRHQFDWNNWFVACLVARLRQEQLFSSRMEYERDVAVHRREQAERERDEAVARAEFSEVERDEAVERAKAAEDYYLMKLRAVKERAETWEKRWERQTEALARVELQEDQA